MLEDMPAQGSDDFDSEGADSDMPALMSDNSDSDEDDMDITIMEPANRARYVRRTRFVPHAGLSSVSALPPPLFRRDRISQHRTLRRTEQNAFDIFGSDHSGVDTDNDIG